MKLDIDSQVIAITCPHCSKKFDEKIGRLKRDPKLTCSGCGGTIAIDAAKLRAGIQSADKSLDLLRRTLSKIGK